MNKDDNYYRYVYRLRLLESIRSFCIIDDAIDYWERVADTSLFKGNFEQCVEWYNKMAIEHIVDDSRILNDPEWQLEHGYLKNSDELQAVKKLVAPIRSIVNNNQIEDCIFHPSWPKVMDAAQAALDIFDPFYPYTQDTIPDEARQLEANETKSSFPMNAERWLKADLKFDAAGLRENRELGMSEGQKMRLHKTVDSQILFAMMATAVVIGIALTIGWLVFLLIDYRAVYPSF